MNIAIDFDGTCVTHDFPIVGEDIGAQPVLRKLVACGHNIILFTMRSDVVNPKSGDASIICKPGNYLSEAIEWFAKNEIPLWGIQTNPEQHTWTTSPKAYADIYIDDAALGCPVWHDHEIHDRPFVNWVEVERWLTRMGIIYL